MQAKNSRAPQWARWIPALLFAALVIMITCFSTGSFSANVTGQYFGSYNFIARKLAHVSEYAILFLVTRLVFSRVLRSSSTATHCVLAIIFAALFAAGDEWHQSFVPSRTGSVHDMFIDWGGVMLGFLLYLGGKFVLERKRD